MDLTSATKIEETKDTITFQEVLNKSDLIYQRDSLLGEIGQHQAQIESLQSEIDKLNLLLGEV